MHFNTVINRVHASRHASVLHTGDAKIKDKDVVQGLALTKYIAFMAAESVVKANHTRSPCDWLTAYTLLHGVQAAEPH